MLKLEKQFMKAVAIGDTAGVQQQLKQGTSINIMTKEKITPLMIAAKNNDAIMVKFLIDNKADVEMVDYLGRDAVDYAEKYRSAAALMALLTYGGDDENVL
jgi:ankyrin repeat protein